MRIKRVLQGTALTALAAAAWMGAGTADASAAEFPKDNVEVSLSGDPSMRVTIPDDGCKEIMFGVATFNKNKGVKIADTAWDVYETSEVDEDEGIIINLSKLNNTKDNYVAVKSESTDPIYIRIRGSVKGQKAKYNPKEFKLEITNPKKVEGSDVKTETDVNGNWEYRTSYGYWDEIPFQTWVPELNEDGEYKYGENGKPIGKYEVNSELFKEYQYQGATLYVRAAGKSITEERTNPDGNYKYTVSVLKEDTAGVKVVNSDKNAKLYDAGWMPGKESKVNIAKMANGPKVTADYVKGIVKVPAGSEYRLIASGCAIVTDKENKPFDNASKSDKTVADLLKTANGETGVATSGVIEVRKKATDKKSPSKWTRIAIGIPDAIKFTAKEIDKDAITIATGNAVEIADGIKIEAQSKGKDKVYSGKVKVTAGSYDITVTSGGKTKTIKATRNINVDVSDGGEIEIAKAGVKKTQTWVSAGAKLKINIKK